jgi:hypothetical protein
MDMTLGDGDSNSGQQPYSDQGYGDNSQDADQGELGSGLDGLEMQEDEDDMMNGFLNL